MLDQVECLKPQYENTQNYKEPFMENNWYDLNDKEQKHLIEQQILGYEIISLSEDYAIKILTCFSTYQVTKLFPINYRTIIESNKNVAFAKTLIDSVCIAALKAKGYYR